MKRVLNLVPNKMTEKVEIESLRQKVADRVTQKPEKTALILSEWLKRPAKIKTLKKKAG